MQDFLDWAAPGSVEWRMARELSPDRIPRHIAVIMDGNGRWAKRRRLPRAAGHSAGVRPVREIIAACCRLGIETLTLYAFSVENWKRPQAEIETLWALLRKYLRQELPDLKANGVRFQTIGQTDALPESVCDEIDRAILETAANEGMRLNIALNYSGRAEIVEVVNGLLHQAHQCKQLVQVSERDLSERMCTASGGDPDLLIRTSGEFRVSNFLLWQIAYSEIWVTERYWPDFRTTDLLEALVVYQKRNRRFGGLPGQGEEAVAATVPASNGKLLAVNE
ncbi:MAG: isoprenyl transferase [Acidobacteriia bacterium]|nr:isoprenyl transferase [Terriglobia bacterium]MYG04062.1 isoprenyl transferase [Terriglobia bacterium]MYK10330.1 isoprenyl transferase [Terriglobia bacterium]